MSFRKYGGTQFASSHNVVKSNVNTTGSFYVTENIGQPNTYINFESDISGNMNIYGNLDVSGNITSSGNIDCSGNLHVQKNIDCSGNLVVTGNTDISGNLHVQKNTDISGNLVVTGNTDISGNLHVQKNIDCSGNVTANYMFLTSGTNYTTAGNGVVPKSYVDSVSNGLTPLPACIVCKNDASFNPFPPSGYGQTIDGVLITSDFSGNAVLINAQGGNGIPNINNGVYIIKSGSWTRAPYLTTGDKATGTATFILRGNTYANYRFVCTTGTNTSPALIGTAAVLWSPFDIPFTLGEGLIRTNSGTVIQVDPSLNFIQYLDNSGNTLNIGNYTPTINIGNNQAAISTLNLGASMTGGAITIGNNSATTSTTVTNIANGSGQQGALNIGSTAGNGRAINIGNLSTGGVTTIQGATLTLNPQASGTLNLGASMTTGSIQIGGTTGGSTTIGIGNGTSQTGPITINRNGGGNTNINGWTIVGSNNILNASGDIQIDTTGGAGRGMYLGGSISTGTVQIAAGTSQTGPISMGTGALAKTITIGSAASTVAINGTTTVTGTTNITGTTTVTGTLITTADANINSLTVGRGSGNVSTNTAFGLDSLYRNSTGQYNTAIGFISSNKNTTGSQNTTIGYNALYNNTIGGNNTAIGVSAGFDLSGNSGSNTFLGSGADVSSNTLIYNYSTAVGFNATIDASNQMVLGGNASGVPYPSIKIPGSYVGINGAYNPASGFVLDVSGSISAGNTSFVHLSTGAGLKQRTLWMLYSGNSSSTDYGVIQVEDQGIAFRSLLLNPYGGNVGIGGSIATTSPYLPQYLLDVSGNGNFIGVKSYGNSSTSANTPPDFTTNNTNNHNLVLVSTKASSGTPYSMALGVDCSNGFGYINTAGQGQFTNLCLQTRGFGGNVGIGTTTPLYTLDVSGNTNIAGNFLISQTTLPPSSTTQLGYTFNSTASITIGSDYTALTNLSVIAGVYMVTAQCDVYYSPYPPNYTSWLRLSLNTTSSTSFNDACAQDYFPSSTTGNFYIRITGIFTVSSSSNIYVVGRYGGGVAPSTTSTVLSYTRIG